MPGPISPYTTLQMSLQVDQMEQNRVLHSNQQQGLISQEMNMEKNMEQKQVKQKDESEKARINSENEEEAGMEAGVEQEKENEEEKEDDKENYAGEKGNILDVKI